MVLGVGRVEVFVTVSGDGGTRSGVAGRTCGSWDDCEVRVGDGADEARRTVGRRADRPVGRVILTGDYSWSQGRGRDSWGPVAMRGDGFT